MPKTSQSKITIDHEEIKKWVEERNGKPAKVKDSEDGSLLQFAFDEDEVDLELISWEQFFKIFEDNNLALFYQEQTQSGRISNFFKFINRDLDEEVEDLGDEELEDEEADGEEGISD